MYRWFPEKLEQAQQLLEAQNVALGFKFNPPASQADIKRCEEELGFILPNSYKEFLRFSNGANIFCSDEPSFEINSPWWTDSGVLIQSTSFLVSFNQYQDKVYVEDDGEKKYIAFCRSVESRYKTSYSCGQVNGQEPLGENRSSNERSNNGD